MVSPAAHSTSDSSHQVTKPSQAPCLVVTFTHPLSQAERQAIAWVAQGPRASHSEPARTAWLPAQWQPGEFADQAAQLLLTSDSFFETVQSTITRCFAGAPQTQNFELVVDHGAAGTASDRAAGLMAFILSQTNRLDAPPVVCCRAPHVQTAGGTHSPTQGLVCILAPQDVTLPEPWSLAMDPGTAQEGSGEKGAAERDCRAILGHVTHSARSHALPSIADLSDASLRLTRIVSRLRAEDGCPWDREQSFASLRPYMIEEAYEASDAAWRLAKADTAEERSLAAAEFAGELGDVLLQVLLNAQLAAEEGLFDLSDVMTHLSLKMVRRHPHVFDTERKGQARSAGEVEDVWQQVKQQEKAAEAAASPTHGASRRSLLHEAAKKTALPTLDYAAAVSRRSSKLGFCWLALADVWSGVESEIRELKSEVLTPNSEPHNLERIADEVGDVVYTLANLLVHLRMQHGYAAADLGFDDAVRQAVAKFITRFQEMETLFAEENGRPLDEATAKSLDLVTWNKLWKKAKARRYR